MEFCMTDNRTMDNKLKMFDSSMRILWNDLFKNFDSILQTLFSTLADDKF